MTCVHSLVHNWLIKVVIPAQEIQHDVLMRKMCLKENERERERERERAAYSDCLPSLEDVFGGEFVGGRGVADHSGHLIPHHGLVLEKTARQTP